MRCVCCNSVMGYKKMKPVTTFSGDMDSVYTDRIEGFPKNATEDLCNKCISEIRNYNISLNDQISTRGFGSNKDSSECFAWNVVRLQEDDEFIKGTDCPELRMDVEFERVERDYHGKFKFTE